MNETYKEKTLESVKPGECKAWRVYVDVPFKELDEQINGTTGFHQKQ